jgi:hypothetical protein
LLAQRTWIFVVTAVKEEAKAIEINNKNTNMAIHLAGTGGIGNSPTSVLKNNDWVMTRNLDSNKGDTRVPADKDD